MLSEEERERIAAAIREAESRTAGEIVVVVSGQASDYRAVPLLYALLGALLVPWPLIWASDLSAARIFTTQLAAALALLVGFSVPNRRSAFLPAFMRRALCREAAARQFQAQGLTRTRGRTGVLIYMAVAERYAEVVADVGIATHVNEHVWRETVAALVQTARAGRVADALATAVRRVGNILAEHAPRRPGDTDEIPNKVIVI